MKKNTFLLLFLSMGILGFSACENVTDPQASTVSTYVNRLIFESDADSGGHLKVEIKDTFIENLLDGNGDVVTPLLLPPTPLLPFHESLVDFTFTDVNYYGETIADITCSGSSESLLPLLWEGPLGEYYEGPNGYLYLDDTIIGSQYILQGSSDVISGAVVVSSFHAECTSSDGEAYRATLYPASNVLSHGISTSFSVDKGTLKGIVRLHRVGDGHDPFIDLLF